MDNVSKLLPAVEWVDWARFGDWRGANFGPWHCLKGDCKCRYVHKAGLVVHMLEKQWLRLGTVRQRDIQKFLKRFNSKRGKKASPSYDSDVADEGSATSDFQRHPTSGVNLEAIDVDDLGDCPGPWNDRHLPLMDFEAKWGTVLLCWQWEKARQYQKELDRENKDRLHRAGPEPKRPIIVFFIVVFTKVVDLLGLGPWTCLLDVNGIKAVLTILADSVYKPALIYGKLLAIDAELREDSSSIDGVTGDVGGTIMRNALDAVFPFYKPHAVAGMRGVREFFAECAFQFVRDEKNWREWSQRLDASSISKSARHRYTLWKNEHKADKVDFWGKVLVRIYTTTHGYSKAAAAWKAQLWEGCQDSSDNEDMNEAAALRENKRKLLNVDLYLSDSPDESESREIAKEILADRFEARLTRSAARQLAAHEQKRQAEIPISREHIGTPLLYTPIVRAPSKKVCRATSLENGSPDLVHPRSTSGANAGRKLALDRGRNRKSTGLSHIVHTASPLRSITAALQEAHPKFGSPVEGESPGPAFELGKVAKVGGPNHITTTEGGEIGEKGAVYDQSPQCQSKCNFNMSRSDSLPSTQMISGSPPTLTTLLKSIIDDGSPGCGSTKHMTRPLSGIKAGPGPVLRNAGGPSHKATTVKQDVDLEVDGRSVDITDDNNCPLWSGAVGQTVAGNNELVTASQLATLDFPTASQLPAMSFPSIPGNGSVGCDEDTQPSHGSRVRIGPLRGRH